MTWKFGSAAVSNMAHEAARFQGGSISQVGCVDGGANGMIKNSFEILAVSPIYVYKLASTLAGQMGRYAMALPSARSDPPRIRY